MSEAIEATQSGVRGERRMVTIALMLAMAVVAAEQTVVSPAMPTIISSLKRVDIYPWVFSAYLLVSTVSTPIYGKLADLRGRKRILLFGVSLFLVGSMLSGLAQTMPQLIAMRAFQGLGAGAVGPIVLTLLSDLYSLEERAKVQGLFSGVWGVAGLAGPALGGVLTKYLSWRWVFFVTVPFGGIALWVLARHVHEHIKPREVRPIDWTGAVLLASGSSLLLLGALGGMERSWLTETILLALALSGLVGFALQENRAADPILPPDLVTQPTIAAALLGNLLIGALMLGLDAFVPLYVQGVQGGDAARAGAMITPLFVSWAISVAVAAKIVVRMGFRGTCFLGTVLVSAGTALLVVGTMNSEWTGRAFFTGMAMIGVGMGPTSLSFLLSVQNAVSWNRRGAATGAVTFFRSMGSSLGVGLLGAINSYLFLRRLPNAARIDINAALRPETHYLLTASSLAEVQMALRRSLTEVFLIMFGLSLLSLVCGFWLPAGRAISRVGRAAEGVATHGPDQSPLAATAEL